MRLSEIQSKHLQKLIERWQVAGLDPSTIRNTLMPLRVVYRRARRLGDVAVNPTANLDLPAVRGQRERIATAQEAAILTG
jgi:site-specific recombinase XerD